MAVFIFCMARAEWMALSPMRSSLLSIALTFAPSNLSALFRRFICFWACDADLVMLLMADCSGRASAPILSVKPLNASAI